MNIEINLDDYISEEEKKDIATSMFTGFLRNKIVGDYERILSNISYNIVFKMIDEELGLDSKELIKSQTIKVINKLSLYEVFRSNYNNTEKTLGQQYLDESVAESKELIREQVLKIVNEKLASLSSGDKEYELTQIIEDVVGKVIYEKLIN